MKIGLRWPLAAIVTGLCSLIFLGIASAETPEKIPESTRVVIDTSGPVAYRHVYTSDPPRITFHFLQKSVYGRFQESIPIQKGIVDRIEAVYFEGNASPGVRRPIKMLTFYLLAETTYEVFENARSLALVVHHPEDVPLKDLPRGKVMLSTLPQAAPKSRINPAELSRAFEAARAKMAVQTSPGPLVAAALPRVISGKVPVEKTSALSSISKIRPSASPASSEPVFSAIRPWYQSPLMYYAFLFGILLGGLLWPPSWFSIQNRILRKEQRQSWEMAKRIMALKEESVAHEEAFVKAIASSQEKERSLQSQVALLKEANLTLQEDAKILVKGKEDLQKEIDRHSEDLHELAKERMELTDRLEAMTSELDEKNAFHEEVWQKLRDLSTRYDAVIAERRRLETELEELKEGKTPARKTGEEKRRWMRFAIPDSQDTPLTVEVQGPSGRLIYGYPKDVSLGGLSFELKEKVELPDPLSLTLFFPEQKSGLAAQGKVIWKIQEGGKSRYGIRFVDLPQNGSTLITHFVKGQLPPFSDEKKPE